MTKIHVVKPEIGISGLDTHILAFCLATGACLFSGEKVSNNKIWNKVFPSLVNGSLMGSELEEITNCEVMYFPNGQRTRYWNIVKAMRCVKDSLVMVNRCGNYIQEKGESDFINRIFDKVVVSSSSLESNLIEWGVDRNRIILLRNVISNEFKCVPPQKIDNFKEKYELKNKYVLLYPGRFASMSIPGEIVTYKGLLVALKALKHIQSNAHLLIAGTDINDHAKLDMVRDKIRKIIFSLSLQDRVTFLEASDCLHKNFPTAISSSNIVLHPNTEPEPFGTVVLEAMLNKKPVVITRMTGAIEVMNIAKPECSPEEVDAVLVEEGNEFNLTQKAIQLMNNPDLVERIGENAYKTASKFTEEKLFPIYRDILTRN